MPIKYELQFESEFDRSNRRNDDQNRNQTVTVWIVVKAEAGPSRAVKGRCFFVGRAQITAHAL